MKKKFLLILPAVYLAFCLFSAGYTAEEEYGYIEGYDGTFAYTVKEDNTAEITAIFFPELVPEVLEIPSEIDGKTVTAVLKNSLQNFGFREIWIPDTITMLEGNPFHSGSAALFIVSPDNPNYEVRGKGLYSKADNRLICYPIWNGGTLCTLSEGTEIIGEAAFRENETLKEIVFPEGVRTICDNLFDDGSAPYKIYLPSSVTEIAEKAFDSWDTVMFVEPDSYAAGYCEEKGFPFAVHTGDQWILKGKTDSEMAGSWTLYKLHDSWKYEQDWEGDDVIAIYGKKIQLELNEDGTGNWSSVLHNSVHSTDCQWITDMNGHLIILDKNGDVYRFYLNKSRELVSHDIAENYMEGETYTAWFAREK